MKNFLMSSFVVSLMFGFTNTVINLTIFRGLDDRWFALSGLLTGVFVYAINLLVTKDGVKEWVWKYKWHLMIVDTVVYVASQGSTFISHELRVMMFATINVLTSEFYIILWESVKQKTGKGVELNSRMELHNTAGFTLGSALYLILIEFGIKVSMDAGVIAVAVVVALQLPLFMRACKEAEEVKLPCEVKEKEE